MAALGAPVAPPRLGQARQRIPPALKPPGMASDQQRAEEAVTEAERVVKDAANQAGGLLARLLARTREEVEDVWAEAQSISRSRADSGQ